jgi:3-deoxy-D-manno-octulosonate 8-phosphate phosphatase (KDO 8-P phosphatase)
MMKPLHPAAGKAGAVRCVVFDVDGVLTEGGVVIGPSGEEWKVFSVRDGLRMVLARRFGLKTALITGRTSRAVSVRAEELGIDHVFQKADDKVACMGTIMEREGFLSEELAFLGDDLPDLPAMRTAGLSGAVADAAPEVRDAADWVSASSGGRGAAGEFIEFLLRSQGRWEEILSGFGV